MSGGYVFLCVMLGVFVFSVMWIELLMISQIDVLHANCDVSV